MRYGSPALEVRWSAPRPRTVRAYSHLAGPGPLARELALARSGGDEAVISAALARWGADGPARLAGPFVFAADSGDRLLLGRDQLGQFPLYHARVPGGVLVSVDLQALLADPRVDDELDLELAACRYARAHRQLLRRTPFRRVGAVPPGSVLTLTAGGEAEYRYWRPEEIAVRRRTPADWAEEVRALLPVVVADAIPPGVTVGAHLSGGLDSTTVAVLAERAGHRPAAVYSWSPPPAGPPPPPSSGCLDERWLVERVAVEHGWTPRYVPSGGELAEAQATGVHPLATPWETWDQEVWVARDAAARGIGVLLSGWGGDEFASFNGRSGFRALARRGRWVQLARQLRRRGEIRGHQVGAGAVLSMLIASLLPAPVTDLVRARRGGPARRVSRADGWDAYPLAVRTLREDGRRVGGARTPHQAQLALLGLGHLADRCAAWSASGARFGVAYRFPLLDPRLVTLALSAPASCYLWQGWERYGFRLAASAFLPPEVAWNPTKDEPVLNALQLASVPVVGNAGLDPRLVDLERTALQVMTARRALLR